MIGTRYCYGLNGHVYVHESTDDEGLNLRSERDSADVRNISARAIGRTFHEVWEMDGHYHTALIGLTPEDKARLTPCGETP